MNYILIFLIGFVLLIDFIRLKKNNLKLIGIYLIIVTLILLVVISDKYIFDISPLETALDKLQPINDWVETKFD